MKIKIIIPVHNDWESQQIPDGAFLYPEEKKTPRQQVDWLKDVIDSKSFQDDIFVVTTSSYIAEGFSSIHAPVKDGDNFGSGIEAVYSDGKDDIDSDVFWKCFSYPMKEIAFSDTMFTLKS